VRRIDTWKLRPHVFVLTFPHPGLYWIYGNKDDDDDDEKKLLGIITVGFDRKD
jgi:hypothetical protein